MKIFKEFFVVFCLINFLIFAQEKDFKTKNFNVGKNGKINVKLAAGGININTWDKNQVSVNTDENDEDFSGIKFSQNGNIIDIKSSSFSLQHIDISIPSYFNVDLKTDAGAIKINGKIFGNIEVRTSGGDIQMDDAEGNIELKTDGGNITTGKIKGNAEISSAGGHLKLDDISGKAEVKTAGGNISMQNVGSNAEIKTAGGNIQVENINGEAEVKTGGGNISIGNVSKNVEAKTGGGNIEIKSANGIIEAKTGAGNIDLKNITGSIEAASGAGSIYVELTPSSKSKNEIKTKMGDIELLIPQSAKTEINVETSAMWGESEIYSDFPSAGEKDGNKKYILNDGGSNIQLQNFGGTIEIKKLTK